ncbi:multidrug effflux MFS transporter [Xanthobacter sp. TB0139]|uniref:multidrug effflux MFS transporter n=1 Tax=Xanthobacter sp. TB0139 TaxID=3459178 RepID=UPI00403A15C9
MAKPKVATSQRDGAFLPFPEFVALIALMMGLTAFSIDNLLPAFPQMRDHFGLENANDVQITIYAYLIGFGAAQIIYGPLSDVYGRRPLLAAGLAIYVAGGLLALFTDDFFWLIVARVVQGIGSASPRVLSVAIVRDRFAGRDMARIMSFAMMVFLTVPIIAPALGSLALAFGPWHLIFIFMLVLALVLWAWFGLRMPETLHPEYRQPLSARAILEGIRLTLSNRRAAGYSTAIGFMVACLMTYVGTSAQLFEDVYHLGHWFPAVFALVAGVMAVASFTNAMLVRRIGMRRLSHGGLVGFIFMAALMALVALIWEGRPPLLLFVGLVALTQFLFSLTAPNFNSMAMEPLGTIAGTASSFIGCYTTLMSAVLALFAGQAFDGTVLPLSLSYLVMGLAALLAALWAENWRLFGHQD